MNRTFAQPIKSVNNLTDVVKHLKTIFIPPLFFVIAVIVIDYSYNHFAYLLAETFDLPKLNVLVSLMYWVCLALGFFWLFRRLVNYFTDYLLTTSFFMTHPRINILLPFLSSLLKTVVFLVIFNTLAPHLGLPRELSYLLDKTSSILIICAITWILFKLIHIAEQLLLVYYSANTEGDVTSRKMYTQTLILRRIATCIVSIFTIGAILMLFDNVRALGASVLTTAGVIGLVLTFTAQRSLASLFSGLEIALTQPIKIGDAVVVENEFGIIEEINFRSVIIKLWDWRRLVVPTNYFLEKPFQNWSREESNNLIGTVYLYADFTLPLPQLREELKKILQATPLWDGKVGSIQVSDLQDRVMQLRVLSSAKSPSEAWDLRCEVREKLISFLAHVYPQCLPASRTKPVQESAE